MGEQGIDCARANVVEVDVRAARESVRGAELARRRSILADFSL